MATRFCRSLLVWRKLTCKYMIAVANRNPPIFLIIWKQACCCNSPSVFGTNEDCCVERMSVLSNNIIRKLLWFPSFPISSNLSLCTKKITQPVGISSWSFINDDDRCVRLIVAFRFTCLPLEIRKPREGLNLSFCEFKNKDGWEARRKSRRFATVHNYECFLTEWTANFISLLPILLKSSSTRRIQPVWCGPRKGWNGSKYNYIATLSLSV